MNSLRKNHLLENRLLEEITGKDPHCWEYISCENVLCPAHGRHDRACWLRQKTHCTLQLIPDFFKKLAFCLSCAFFRYMGSLHPEGWHQFLSEQIQQYNARALEHLYQKEESYVEILNRLPDGLFTTDHEFRISYFNPAAEKITGFSAADALGMYCKDVFKNSICESDCALKKAMAENRSIHNREYQITNIDGKKIPIICSTSVFKDSLGNLVGGLEIFKDISEVKELRKEIANREKKYHRIFEGSHDMIYTTNIKGEILDINPAGVEMMGYPDRETMLQQCTAADFYRNPEDRKHFLKQITTFGFVKDYEVKFQTRQGSILHVLISSRKYENSETEDVEFEGIIKDITQRKITEESLKQRNRELSLLNKIAVALNHNMPLNSILKESLRNVLKILDLKKGAVFLIDRQDSDFTVEANIGLPVKEKKKGVRIIFKDGLLGRSMLERNIQLIPKPTFPAFKARCESTGGFLSNWLTCFIILSKGRARGFFALDIPEDRILDANEMNLMGSLANFLGGAIENAQLMQTIRQHRQDLRRLTEKLFDGQEEERRRIARELHDEAGQSLTAVKLALERLEEQTAKGTGDLQYELSRAIEMVKRTSAEIRRISYNLHPTLLMDLGLEPALRLYFSEIQNRCNLDIEFNFVGFDRRLDPDIETVLYRFSQEALNNTLKHSGAELFRLSIIKSFPRIIFIAEDDGTGFDPGVIEKDRRSLGLLGMRERTALLNGSFNLKSVINGGTRIRIEIPIFEEMRHG